MKLTIEHKLIAITVVILIIIISAATCSCSTTKTVAWCDYDYIYYNENGVKKTPNKTHESYFVGDKFKID